MMFLSNLTSNKNYSLTYHKRIGGLYFEMNSEKIVSTAVRMKGCQVRETCQLYVCILAERKSGKLYTTPQTQIIVQSTL